MEGGVYLSSTSHNGPHPSPTRNLKILAVKEGSELVYYISIGLLLFLAFFTFCLGFVIFSQALQPFSLNIAQ